MVVADTVAAVVVVGGGGGGGGGLAPLAPVVTTNTMRVA